MIVNHNVAYDKNFEEIKSWYKNFGFENASFDSFQSIRSDVNIEALLMKVNEITEKTLKMKAETYNGLIQEKINYQNSMIQREEEMKIQKEREQKMESYPHEEISNDLKILVSRGRDEISDEIKGLSFSIYFYFKFFYL
jgi:hypothetical protein